MSPNISCPFLWSDRQTSILVMQGFIGFKLSTDDIEWLIYRQEWSLKLGLVSWPFFRKFWFYAEMESLSSFEFPASEVGSNTAFPFCDEFLSKNNLQYWLIRPQYTLFLCASCSCLGLSRMPLLYVTVDLWNAVFLKDSYNFPCFLLPLSQLLWNVLPKSNSELVYICKNTILFMRLTLNINT